MMPHVLRQLTVARLARLAWLPLCLFLVACHVDMYDQPRYTANQPSDFFEDGRAMRAPVPNTVSMNSFNPDSALTTGRLDGSLVAELPSELILDEEFIARGQVVYNSYCAPCHGLLGDGQGVVAQRGPLTVPSFHNDRLRTVAIGYLFDVMTNGVGRMYPYGPRITPEDRWAAAAYVRALQLSQNADVESLPADDQAGVEAAE